MIKKFFISMLGTMAGLWLSLFIFILLCIAAVGAFIGKSMQDNATLSDKSILRIDLKGSIPERAPELTLNDILDLESIGAEPLCDILEAVRKAASDSKIHGIIIKCEGSSLGIASRGELVDALKKFKDTGKWIYSYADNYSQGDYYVASVADRVFLNPVGMADVHGLGSQTIFFKNLLDKVGVEVQVVKVGSYKSAVEPFIRTGMSEPSREQTSIFLNQIWDHVSAQIAENRSVDASDVKAWADGLSMTWAPERYVDDKIVSELAYYSEFENEIRNIEKIDTDNDLPCVTPTEYLGKNELAGIGNADKKHIAVYYAAGDIVDSGEGGIVATKVVPDIEKLTKNDKVAGLILRVNSGGGSAFASEQIWYALEKFKETGRPFYVSMGDYAASGGYYISCGADSIFADPATLTGSIGIFGLIPNAQKLLNDKLGVNFDVVQTNPNAVFPNITGPMTPEQYAGMQKYVERGYDTFTSRVAAGREMSQDSVKAIGGGRVWDGMTALKIGLVDHLGTLQDAIDAMAEATGIDNDRFVAYPENSDDWLALLMSSGLVKAGISADEIKDAKEYKKYIDYVKYITTMSPIQARMEPIVVK